MLKLVRLVVFSSHIPNIIFIFNIVIKAVKEHGQKKTTIYLERKLMFWEQRKNRNY